MLFGLWVGDLRDPGALSILNPPSRNAAAMQGVAVLPVSTWATEPVATSDRSDLRIRGRISMRLWLRVSGSKEPENRIGTYLYSFMTVFIASRACGNPKP